MTMPISHHLGRFGNKSEGSQQRQYLFLMKIGNIYLSIQYSYTNTANSYIQATMTMPIKGNLAHLSKFSQHLGTNLRVFGQLQKQCLFHMIW